MLADRRDFTVATYSSARGTGAKSIVWTFTGNACGAGCLASVLVHPVFKSAARPITETDEIIASFLNLVIWIVLHPIPYQHKMLRVFRGIQNLESAPINPETQQKGNIAECSFFLIWMDRRVVPRCGDNHPISRTV